MPVTVADVRSADQLMAFISGGGQPKYLLFWGHQPPAAGGIGKGCLSQWWPGAAKALGRQVRGFDDQRWADRRFDLVVTANMARFGQHAELRDFLLDTGHRVLVETSPQDRIWGIGLTADDERAGSPDAWLGLNLLGFALMEVRRLLRAGGAEEGGGMHDG